MFGERNLVQVHNLTYLKSQRSNAGQVTHRAQGLFSRNHVPSERLGNVQREQKGLGGRRGRVVAVPASSLLDPILKPDEMTREVYAIAWPALLALACEPIASLVDTAWIGRIGPSALAGAAVGIALFNSLSKLMNNPLLSVTTSLIARARGRAYLEPCEAVPGKRICIGSAGGAALLLGLLSGVLQTLVMVPFGAGLLAAAGIPRGSLLWEGAWDMLYIKGYGATITAALLVCTGIFRGIGDTKPPLTATIVVNVINLILDPLLVFGLAWGTQGAAIATVFAQGVGFIYLVSLLRDQGALRFEKESINDALATAIEFLRPTGLLIIRTCATMGCFLVASSLAAQCGSALGAVHQVCFQLWLAASLLADSLSIAGQSLLARALGSGDLEWAVRLVHRVAWLGATLGLLLALAITAVSPFVPAFFTPDAAVRKLVAEFLPVVAFTQPLAALAFTLDGVLFGAGGFKTSAKMMPFAALPAIAVMVLGCRYAFASSPVAQLWCVWGGLAVFMALRASIIWALFVQRRGPFKVLPPPADGLGADGIASAGALAIGSLALSAVPLDADADGPSPPGNGSGNGNGNGSGGRGGGAGDEVLVEYEPTSS